MIAHLGMYDFGPASAAFWSLVRAHLGYGPEHLTHADDVWPIWQSPDLLLSQTCGYPYRARLHGSVELVGTPDFGLESSLPGHYRSVFISTKRTTLAQCDGARFAYNEALSQSGWAGPVQYMADRSLAPGPALQTGSHANSVRAVADGHADFAAIDALTWHLLTQSDPQLAKRVRIFDTTDPTPGLPFITAYGRDVRALQNAIDVAIDALPDAMRAVMPIKGLIRIPAPHYLAVRTPMPP